MQQLEAISSNLELEVMSCCYYIMDDPYQR
jgi:hypothetical protein